MRLIVNVIFAFLFFLSITRSNAQIHCGSVELFLEEQGNSAFTFTDFSKYQSGYPRTTIARLKVRVTDKVIPDNLCSWNLILTVNNNGANSTEWEVLNHYSDGTGPNPLLSILEVRITNDCMTSEDFSNFVPLSDVNDILEIIKPIIGTLEASDVIPSNSCVKNVNGIGDYISNYSEYTFKIEVRLKPGMTFNPGTFALNFNFRLEENI
ncbi:hypothetical protein [Flavicella sp.]|uniref:hypothetical protein n=1 Tax=Flavicella sp. TaxID=2957742 RepID=UPI0026370859|nr:hypothetical protein [Flavicella sp.]MDG1803753.1 hypothetical protein [Flavicella sp.]MDG2279923.1 hypothetical protein [Flavicella sp.]